jgi:16S rRNA (guanine966-N2)-methyltransferase|tara:strand:- start:1963 stop:2529 length:567 start_codon:yes stop_codon:yes gene_type:complete
MRIISGIAKGKKIFTPPNKKTRPLRDMVRESIFNIISHSNLLSSKFDQSIILDLFSGVGSFGLEAISRGAKKVIFFEDYIPAIELLIKNINILSFNKQTEINKKNIYNQNNFKKLNYKFDIVFLDPPFKDNNIKLILDNLANAKILNSETLIIMHRHKKTEDNFDKKFKTIRKEIYGSSKVIFGFIIF